jgi:hypothetical protein
MSKTILDKPSITTHLDWIIDIADGVKPLGHLTATDLNFVVANYKAAGNKALADSFAGLELALRQHRGNGPQPFEVGDLDEDEFDLMFWGPGPLEARD